MSYIDDLFRQQQEALEHYDEMFKCLLLLTEEIINVAQEEEALEHYDEMWRRILSQAEARALSNEARALSFEFEEEEQTTDE